MNHLEQLINAVGSTLLALVSPIPLFGLYLWQMTVAFIAQLLMLGNTLQQQCHIAPVQCHFHCACGKEADSVCGYL